ncbi:hypothetical protein BGZ57DRAFT_646178 [Hyaloscypha finlandica]|nr:hypothetical protein BGZ57DRAFT_646178 [Hyaloscypha finlandica]
MGDTNALSIAAFTALGTIVGYLGTEVASASIFGRLLWPSRSYNTTEAKSLAAMALLLPMGGPIHKGAVEALNQLSLAGLWMGYCRGDMLGTAFYPDTAHRYVVRDSCGSSTAEKEARNSFWIRIMEIAARQQRLHVTSDGSTADLQVQRSSSRLRTRRPVFLLTLSRANGEAAKKNDIIEGDIGAPTLRTVAGTVASELVTLVFGVITAVLWRSFFSIWYLAPVILKLAALFFTVQRTPVASVSPPPADEGDDSTGKPSAGAGHGLYQVKAHADGFFLIQGPSDLVLQFFRHYGHPIRSRRGLRGDRVREVASMLTVVAFACVYPAGLLAFIFAPIPIQWAWVGYQCYTMVSMHIYRFCGGEHVGTTEARVAQALSDRCLAKLADGSGNIVVAALRRTVVSSVGEGGLEVERLVEESLGINNEGE